MPSRSTCLALRVGLAALLCFPLLSLDSSPVLNLNIRPRRILSLSWVRIVIVYSYTYSTPNLDKPYVGTFFFSPDPRVALARNPSSGPAGIRACFLVFVVKQHIDYH